MTVAVALGGAVPIWGERRAGAWCGAGRDADSRAARRRGCRLAAGLECSATRPARRCTSTGRSPPRTAWRSHSSRPRRALDGRLPTRAA